MSDSILQTVEKDAVVVGTWIKNLLVATEPLLAVISPVADLDARLAIAFLQALITTSTDAQQTNSLTALAHAVSADPTKAASVLEQFGIKPYVAEKVVAITPVVAEVASNLPQFHSDGGDR